MVAMALPAELEGSVGVEPGTRVTMQISVMGPDMVVMGFRG